MSALTSRFEPLSDRQQAVTLYARLAAAQGFFLSPAWIRPWLAAVPADHALWLFQALRDNRPIAAAVIGFHQNKDVGLIAGRNAYLHETGLRRLDRLEIEDNGLCFVDGLDDSDRLRVVGLLRTALSTELCDEVILRNLAPDQAALFEQAFTGGPFHRLQRQTAPRPWVDLSAVAGMDDVAGAYLKSLSRNSRQALQRSKRLYAERGALRLERAETVAQGLEFFDRLKVLHQESWRRRDRADAFEGGYFEPMHRDLIAGSLPAGQVDLLHIRAGDETLGYLYNFVHGGWIHSYQSGFAQAEDNRLKPGLVCHHLAIVDAASRGLRAYDFLGGDARYKRSLGNRVDELISLRFAASSFRGQLRRAAQTVRSALRPRGKS